MVLVQEAFTSIEQISNLAIKLDNKIHGVADTSTGATTSVRDPNAMDISSSFVRLSEEERTRRL